MTGRSFEYKMGFVPFQNILKTHKGQNELYEYFVEHSVCSNSKYF